MDDEAPGGDLAVIGNTLGETQDLLYLGLLGAWFAHLESGDGAAHGEELLTLAIQTKPELSEEMIQVERRRFTRAPVVVAVVSKA
ncbi:nitroreductase, partial [Rhizobium ruizarguesonis]